MSLLGRQQRLTGCWMGLPQVPPGSHIRPIDRLTGRDTRAGTHTHTLSWRTHTCVLFFFFFSSGPSAHSCSNPAHILPRHGTLHKAVTLLYISFFFFFFSRHKIIFHPSSLSMLHGSFEMNNGNNRAEDSWDPFKDVGEAMQSGFLGLEKHHAPSK